MNRRTTNHQSQSDQESDRRQMSESHITDEDDGQAKVHIHNIFCCQESLILPFDLFIS